MNILILFDYVFYRIACLYNRRGYEVSKKETGVLILSLIQLTNIITLFDLFIVKENLSDIVPFYYFIIGYIILFGCNYIRYIKLIKFENLENKWGNERPKLRLIKDILIIIYFLVSFIY